MNGERCAGGGEVLERFAFWHGGGAPRGAGQHHGLGKAGQGELGLQSCGGRGEAWHARCHGDGNAFGPQAADLFPHGGPD
ncbi:hypothetical protein SHM7688_02638 [Shimia marina]|uniref:Uncharacterized protein n=1 Tax=Shimia marina TaxID=321267 RepID=A0A0P1FC38_9RHOB|nr:hypothetical protein SHM7688_02638 [Shimia marina]